MTEQELQRERDHEEDLQRLRGFRPIDDTFMRVLFRDNIPLAEYVIRIITNKPDLHLTEKSQTQKDLVRLVGARGLCLDYHGIDDKNQHYDLEVQRASSGAEPTRARYHASALDVENLDAGQDFDDLPTTYIIFLTENDIWKAGKAIYPIKKIIEGAVKDGEELPFNDRQHIWYVNASYKGEDPIGELMHDFLCSDPDEMKTKLMAERARYLKNDPKGVKEMCQVMEDLREESLKRGIERGIDQNRVESIKTVMKKLKMSIQEAMDFLEIPANDQPKYLAKL